MTKIIDGLYVGSDEDFNYAKSEGWAICSCCKDGPHGHRSVLGYTTVGAPKNKDYYFVERDKHLALNLIDAEDPNFIPEKVINKALDFISEHHGKEKVLVHCNAGHSRSPSVMLMYLRRLGEMPYNFHQSERVFHTLYRKYDPAQGIRQYARAHWHLLAPEEE